MPLTAAAATVAPCEPIGSAPMPAAVVSATWIPLTVAALRLNVAERHARRLCTEWQTRGLAEKRDSGWVVHVKADRRLIDVAGMVKADLAAAAAMRLNGTADRHIAAAMNRVAVIRRFMVFGGVLSMPSVWQRFIASLSEAELLPDARAAGLSIRTIGRWRKAYDKGGLAALAPQHTKSGRRRHEAGNDAWAYFEGLVIGGNAVPCTTAYTETLGASQLRAGEVEWKWPSMSVVRRLYSERIPDAIWTAANKGMRAFDALHIPKARRDRLEVGAGEIYCGDERRLDVMVRTETARGWKAHRNVMVTAWYDVRSGCVVGCVVKPYASTETILASLKQAIRAYGKPETILVDWGRDYQRAAGRFKTPRFDLDHFDGGRVGDVLNQLGIRVAMATPYHPQSKPIEAFFRRLKDEFDRLWPSFVGGSPAERHEDRQRDVRHSLHELPTLDDVAALVARYVKQVNSEPHGGHDTFDYTPDYAMQVLRDGPAAMESDAILDIAFGEWIGPRLVGRDGIRWNNRVWGFGDSRVIALAGKQVYLSVQPHDVRTVLVCDEARKPLFTAECTDPSVSTKRELEAHMRMRRALRRDAQQRVSAAREAFIAVPPHERLANRAAGMRALHGEPPQAADAPRIVTVRPEIETPLRTASVTPHESRLKHVQTDADIDIEDLVGGESGRAPATLGFADDDDRFDDESETEDGDYGRSA